MPGGHGPAAAATTQPGLKAQFRIGSVHGRCNYSFAEKAFHKSEVPTKARKAKVQMRALKRGNRLGLQKNSWNGSTFTGVPLCFRGMHQLSKHDHAPYKHNFRAEVLPPKNAHFEPNPSHLEFDRSLLVTDPKLRDEARRPIVPGKRSQEMPVHPRLADKPLWDNGTVVPFETMQKEREVAAAAAREYRKKHSFEVVGYINPVERVRRQQEQMRAKKRALRKNPDFKTAPATVITQALLNDDGSLVEGGGSGEGAKKKKKGGSAAVFKPYKTTVSRKYKKYAHSGVYEFNKIEQKWMWSDTGGEEKDSKGDIVTVVNPDAWNFASPGHD